MPETPVVVVNHVGHISATTMEGNQANFYKPAPY